MNGLLKNYRIKYDYKKAYDDGRLFDNYFIHRYPSPYENYPDIYNFRQRFIQEISNVAKGQIMDNTAWKKRKERQELVMKMIISAISSEEEENNYTKNFKSIDKNLSDIDLIIQFNQQYFNYISSKTAVYDNNGRLDIYEQVAIRSELSELAKNIDKIINGGNRKSGKTFFKKGTEKGDSTRQLLNDFIQTAFFNTTNEILENLRGYLQERLNKLKAEKEKYIKDEKLKSKSKYVVTIEQDIKILIINSFLKKIENPQGRKQIGEWLFLIVDDAGERSYSNVTQMQAGKINELIVGDALRDLLVNIKFDRDDRVYFNVKNTGTEKYKGTNYTVKSDLKIIFDEEIFKKIGYNKSEIERIKKRFPINSNGKLVSNLSLKNYDLNDLVKFQISSQQNTNVRTFFEQMKAMSSNSNINNGFNSILTDENILKTNYILLNEIHPERKNKQGDKFLYSFKKACELMGMTILFALNSQEDEIDFLMINQRIIPSYYFRKLIIKSFQEEFKAINAREKYDSKIFSVQIGKENSKIRSTDENRYDNASDIKQLVKNDMKFINTYGYYSNLYLSSNKSYGKAISDKMYVHNLLKKEWTVEVLKTINNINPRLV